MQRRTILFCLLCCMRTFASASVPEITVDEADVAAAKKAYGWGDYAALLKLAKQGNPEAQYFLGVMYAFGLDVAQDYQEATKWYAAALKGLLPLAKRGNPEAQFVLGLLYANGRGIAEDYQEAVKWYRLAADQGHHSAQSNLGLMYYNGRLPRDSEEARKWHRLAGY